MELCRPCVDTLVVFDKKLEAWSDLTGLTCEAYAEHAWCNSTGQEGPGWRPSWGLVEDYTYDGLSAANACCFCGGGTPTSFPNVVEACFDENVCPGGIPTSTTTTTTAHFVWSITDWLACVQDDCSQFGRRTRTLSCLAIPSGSAVDHDLCKTCADEPSSFLDVEGVDCTTYVEEEWCTPDGGYGAGWDADFGTFEDYAVDGVSAVTACCACGGGRKEDWTTIPVEEACFDVETCPVTITSTTATTTSTTTTTTVHHWRVTAWSECDQPDCSTYGSQTRDYFCTPFNGVGYDDDVAVNETLCEEQPLCEDAEGFLDRDWDDCDAYVDREWCDSQGGHGPGWSSSWGFFETYANRDGLHAGTACCGCGGGRTVGVPKPTDADLVQNCYDSSRCTSTTTTTSTFTETLTTTTVTTTLAIGWSSSPWSECSQPKCNKMGEMTRTITCTDQLGKIFPDSACDEVLGKCWDHDNTWTDTRGKTCEDYAALRFCNSDGTRGPGWFYEEDPEAFARDGRSAWTMCCACGGGRQVVKPVTTAECEVNECLSTYVLGDWSTCDQPPTCEAVGKQMRSVKCVSYKGSTVNAKNCAMDMPCLSAFPDWADKTGKTCEDYVDRQWCTRDGRYGRGWGGQGKFKDFAVNGISALEACCACGGDRREEPAARSCEVDECKWHTTTTILSGAADTWKDLDKVKKTTAGIVESSLTLTGISDMDLVQELAEAVDDTLSVIFEATDVQAVISSWSRVPVRSVGRRLMPAASRFYFQILAQQARGTTVKKEVAKIEQIMTELSEDASRLTFELAKTLQERGQFVPKNLQASMAKGTSRISRLSWSSGDWSTCQAQIGSLQPSGCDAGQVVVGQATRRVFCASGDGSEIPPAWCSSLPEPDWEKPCEPTESVTWQCSRELLKIPQQLEMAEAGCVVRGFDADEMLSAQAQALIRAVGATVGALVGLGEAQVRFTAVQPATEGGVHFRFQLYALTAAALATATSAWAAPGAAAALAPALALAAEERGLVARSTVQVDLEAASTASGVSLAHTLSGWSGCQCDGLSERRRWCTATASGEGLPEALCELAASGLMPAVHRKCAADPGFCTLRTDSDVPAQVSVFGSLEDPAADTDAASAMVFALAAVVTVLVLGLCKFSCYWVKLRRRRRLRGITQHTWAQDVADMKADFHWCLMHLREAVHDVCEDLSLLSHERRMGHHLHLKSPKDARAAPGPVPRAEGEPALGPMTPASTAWSDLSEAGPHKEAAPEELGTGTPDSPERVLDLEEEEQDRVAADETYCADTGLPSEQVDVTFGGRGVDQLNSLVSATI